MKRIVLFLAVNLLVVVAVSAVVRFLGVDHYISRGGVDYGSLLAFCAVFGFMGSFISLQLSRWTAKNAMGVALIDPRNPGGEEEARLVETVSSLCRTAGLAALPEIGIYQSAEVNAFATGPSRNRALLAVSSGLLAAMDRGAVEGVLGHEVAHIANGDMVTMALIQGVVNTFVMFLARAAAFAIDNMLRDRDERGRGMGFFAQFILVSVLETLFMFLAAPIVYWFSRHREYRADRGSAEYLGPPAMIHALESLRECVSRVDNRQPALATFKINGRAGGLWGMLFSSHPSIEDRIEALRRIA